MELPNLKLLLTVSHFSREDVRFVCFENTLGKIISFLSK